MMIERFLDDRLRAKMEDPDDVEYLFILLPLDLDPFQRTYRFGCHLDAELRLAGVGCSAGGCKLRGDDDEDEDPHDPVYTLLDVDASDVDAARSVLRLHLPELGCPAGTLIHYPHELEDRYDGHEWQLAKQRSIEGYD
jgi:hypothetical protein